MNNKGFTVVELLASFTLTMIIVTFLFQIVLEVKDVYLSVDTKTRITDKNGIVANELEKYLTETCPKGSDVCDYTITTNNGQIVINTKTIEMPEKTTITTPEVTNGYFESHTNNGSNSHYVSVKYTVNHPDLKNEIKFNYIYTY